MNTLMPIMEKLLTDLAFKYNNDMSAMPSVKVEAIRRIKDILKDLSEVIIVPQKTTIIKMEEEVVNYSNEPTLKSGIFEIQSDLYGYSG